MKEIYKELKEGELKIDKDLVELQKTIIYFGKKTLEEINNIKILIDMIVHQKEKVIKDIEKGKEIVPYQDPIAEHILGMKIPDGYKK